MMENNNIVIFEVTQIKRVRYITEGLSSIYNTFILIGQRNSLDIKIVWTERKNKNS